MNSARRGFKIQATIRFAVKYIRNTCLLTSLRNSHRVNGSNGIVVPATSNVFRRKTSPLQGPRIRFRRIARAVDGRGYTAGNTKTYHKHVDPHYDIAIRTVKDGIYELRRIEKQNIYVIRTMDVRRRRALSRTVITSRISVRFMRDRKCRETARQKRLTRFENTTVVVG